MPTFEFSTNGSTYEIDAPSEQAALTAFNSAFNPKPAEAPLVEDTLKSAATMPGRAVASMAGLPGDLYHLGLRALGDNLTPRSNYGSEAIRQSLGSDYESQRLPGQLLQKAADFAPAMIGGPETLALKAATRVAAPVVASEAGKAVAGPYGEVAGALLGAGGATAGARKFEQMVAAKRAASAVPSGDALVKTGSSQFDAARDMKVVVKPDWASQTAADARAALADFDPKDAAQADVFRKIDRLDNLASSSPGLPPSAVDMNEVEKVRKQLSKLRVSNDASTREAAKIAQNVITQRQAALTAADTVSGDGALYSKTIRDAVGNYGAGKRAQTIAGKMNLAELNSNSPVGMLDMASDGQAIQRTMKQLARPINNTNVPVARKLGFNPEEVSAITQVANGNKLTQLGDVANHVVPGWAGGGAVSSILRAMGGISVKRQVSVLDSLVRTRSPLAQQVAAQLPPQVIAQLPTKSQRILQTLTVAAPPMRQQVGQPVGYSGAQ